MYFLGIDFGTSFTKAAVYCTDTQKYTAVMLGNVGIQREDGRIPTAAFFINGKNQPIIGDEAINSKKLPNGIFYNNFKPELDSLSNDSKRNEIMGSIVVEFLRHAKLCAEKQCKQIFKNVVITVPASAPQGGIRYQIMHDSAKKAGFEEIEIVPEPVAAAFYLLGDRIHSKEMNGKLFLIYDFGGGTFDSALIRLCDHQIHVIDESVGSDNEKKWGGIYIDSLVGMDYRKNCSHAQELVSILRDKSQPYSVYVSASDHLLSEPIRIKEQLSSCEEYSNVFGYSLSRNEFNDFIQCMVDDTIQCAISLHDMANQDGLCEDIGKVKSVFLVGGTSQIPLVLSRWEFKKYGLGANFSIDVSKKLNIVALGASRYRDLKLSSKQLNEMGIVKARNREYMQAAAYFNNAGDGEGLYWLGILYYIGVIGRRRQPAKAYKLFSESSYIPAKLMMSLMKFCNDGVVKDDAVARELLRGLPDSKLKSALQNVISGGRNSEDLDTIYSFDAESLF